MTTDMRRDLEVYYARAFPDRQAVRISDLVSVSEGWENDVYAFTAEHGPAGARTAEQLILRIYPGNDGPGKSAREFHGMRRLRQAGYPVPQVLILEGGNTPFGRPFIIMEKIDGQMLWPVMENASGARRQELLTRFCGLFVRLHALDWRLFVDGTGPETPEDPYTWIDRELDRWRAGIAFFSRPGFLPIIEWLAARRDRAPCPRPSPIHWDFHPGNVILCDDGSAVVIDWTGLAVSDARFDLAWTLLLAGTHGDIAWRERILREYERLSGTQVDQLAYFDAAVCGKRLFSVAVSMSEGPEKLGMRPGAAAMMKQQMPAIRRVYDLLIERTGIEVPEVETMLASV